MSKLYSLLSTSLLTAFMLFTCPSLYAQSQEELYADSIWVDSCEGPCDSIYHPVVAVKTNMLYDVALTPNIEVERWFGRKMKWSIMAEAQAPWYTWHNGERSFEVLNVGAELRYWFHRNKDKCEYSWRPLIGHFLGVYGSTGYYDIGWNKKGHQGTFCSVGLTYGYAHRLNRRFNLEWSISAGLVHGPWNSYDGKCNGHLLIWTGDGELNYIGITKAKISLVWLIGNHKKKGGKR